MTLAVAILAGSAGIWLGARDTAGPGFHDAAGAAAAGPVTVAQARQEGRRALALLDLPALDLGYALSFAPRPPGSRVRGEIDRDARTITVFIGGADATHVVAHDIAHEVGHAIDDRLLTDAQRREYLDRRGAAGARWWPGGQTADYASGAGDFAEVFALCHSASPEYRSRLAARPADACGVLPDLPQAANGERMDLG